MTDDHQHQWEEAAIEVRPASAESWGPEIAAMLDHPSWGDTVKEIVDAGGAVLSDAEAAEHAEEFAVRLCECGAVEVFTNGEWEPATAVADPVTAPPGVTTPLVSDRPLA